MLGSGVKQEAACEFPGGVRRGAPRRRRARRDIRIRRASANQTTDFNAKPNTPKAASSPGRHHNQRKRVRAQVGARIFKPVYTASNAADLPREEIAMLKAQGAGVREIARRFGRDPSMISREPRRNAATRGGKLDYRASVEQWKAERMARRPKTATLAANDQLREYVQ